MRFVCIWAMTGRCGSHTGGAGGAGGAQTMLREMYVSVTCCIGGVLSRRATVGLHGSDDTLHIPPMVAMQLPCPSCHSVALNDT